ncbi:MAG: hypothetical protein DRN91_07175 [Candidatus Alkanophagales archaeon]|nr:MAG: hypothetical protein DRN91_07175 [Candidatus Alkanophagales archaeon]
MRWRSVETKNIDNRNINNIVILTGFTMDKKYKEELDKLLVKDKDIVDFYKKPIRVQNLLRIGLLLMLLGSSFYTTFTMIPELSEKLKLWLTIIATRFGLSTELQHLIQHSTLIPAAVIFLGAIIIIGTIKKEEGTIKEVWGGLKKCFLSRKYLKSPLDYYTIFLTNISDMQVAGKIAEYLSNELKNENIDIRLFYADMPYYWLRFIDSIYVSADCFLEDGRKETVSKSELEKIWKEVYDEHLEDFYTIIGKYVKGEEFAEIDKGSPPRIKASRFVFGIFFLSRFFKKMYDKLKGRFENKPNIYFAIDLPEDGQSEDIGEEEWSGAKEIIKEIMFLSLRSDAKYISNINDNDIKRPALVIYVKGAKMLVRIKNRGFDLHELGEEARREAVVKLPVKRLIAIPLDLREGTLKPNSDIPFPMFSEEEDKKNSTCMDKKNSTLVISLGGPEHNLALLHLINYLRQRNIPNIPIIQVAESNQWWDEHEYKIQVGTENYVYGIWPRDLHNGRTTLRAPYDEPNGAYIFYDESDDMGFIITVGFNALMTKVATVYMLTSNLFEEFWQGKAGRGILHFVFVKEGKRGRLQQFFDKKDIMNTFYRLKKNDLRRMERMLGKIP